jgi:undecaprenyl-diphosphatase
VQGLTEFLPVSSSGHLVIVPYILNWNLPPHDTFVFDVLVQVATLLAVFAYFWNDLRSVIIAWLKGLRDRQPFSDPYSRLGWFILLATIPAGGIGLFIKDAVESAFDNPGMAAVFLLCTAILLLIAEKVGVRNRSLQSLTWIDALWVGFFQALAIFPGVSRSGATITGGMTRNLNRESAARFSFLMSIPVMLAAGGLAVFDLLEIPDLGRVIINFIPGFVASAVVGYIAIRWLIGYLTRHTLYVFSLYCVILGLSVLALQMFRN